MDQFLDPPLRKRNFRFNYTPDCLVSSMICFYSGKGLIETSPQIPPPFIQSRFALDSGITLNSPPPNMFIPSPNRGGLDQTLISPNPSPSSANSWIRHWEKDIDFCFNYTPCRRHGFEYNFQNKYLGRGSSNL